MSLDNDFDIQELANIIKSQNDEYDKYLEELREKYPFKLTKNGNIKKEYKKEDSERYNSIYDKTIYNAKRKDLSKKYKLKVTDIDQIVGKLVLNKEF